MEKEELIKRLSEAVVEGDEEAAAEVAGQAIAANIEPMVLVKQAIQPAMDIVGKQFECGDAYLPELILAGDAARAALDQIIPHVSTEDGSAAEQGTVVIGTLFGDNHDIGKNIVSAILAAHGFKIVDLGINVQPREYIESALAAGAKIIAASTLITTSLPYQRQIAQTLRDSGHRHQFYFIVGGGPVTPEWAAEIGADGYGRDANDAAAVCRKLLASGLKPPLDKPIVEGALKR
jgi:methylmalonyl-CoA mutase cobalamin-binding domain/chain